MKSPILIKNWEQVWNFRIQISFCFFLIGSCRTSWKIGRISIIFWLVDFKGLWLVHFKALWLVPLDPYIKHFPIPLQSIILTSYLNKTVFVQKMMHYRTWKKENFVHNKGSLGMKWKQQSSDHGHIQLWELLKISDHLLLVTLTMVSWLSKSNWFVNSW